jgi:hypothetical protein
LAQRKRNLSRRAALSSDAQAWLDGEKCGFFQFKPDDELEAVWLEYGDHDTMHWCRDMPRPITLEELEESEDEWLASADSDEYGKRSYFIGKYYSDAEKQTLFAKRGDTNSMYWEPGMWKPRALAETE